MEYGKGIKRFLPAYVECLTELSLMGDYFTRPGIPLERRLRSISAMNIRMPNIFRPDRRTISITTTSSSVTFREPIDHEIDEYFKTKEAEDRYEFNEDGTILFLSAPEGIIPLEDHPYQYPVRQLLTTEEDMEPLRDKLQKIREDLEAQPPVDWSEVSSIGFSV